MQDLIDIIKALSDENRLKALCALKNRELCVCQIIALLELAPSTVSKHMSILRQARLIKGRKEGRWVHYRLPGNDAQPEIREAIDWVFKALSKKKETRAVEQRIKEILKTIPRELCKKSQEK